MENDDKIYDGINDIVFDMVQTEDGENLLIKIIENHLIHGHELPDFDWDGRVLWFDYDGITPGNIWTSLGPHTSVIRRFDDTNQLFQFIDNAMEYLEILKKPIDANISELKKYQIEYSAKDKWKE